MTDTPLIPKDRLVRDRYQGCLLGGAIGDALGAPVEFMQRKEIIRKFGEPGIRDYIECYGKAGAITDDTQMTLFTAEGLLRGYVRGSLRGIEALPSMIASAYLRWLRTQDYHAAASGDGWLSTHAELFARRAPGNTCLSALRQMRKPGDPMIAGNNSKGCGGVMRVAPVGLFCATWKTSDPFELGRDAAAITHGNPTGYLPGGVLAEVVFHLVDGKPLREAVESSLDELRKQDGREETFIALQKALELSRSTPADPVTLKKLGQGWIAEEALAVALYAALSVAESEGTPAERFENGIVLSVNHDGDSDSTGAICGNVLGTLFGKSAIPSRWLESLELREVIEQIADDLATFSQWEISGHSDTETARFYERRYPGD